MKMTGRVQAACGGCSVECLTNAHGCCDACMARSFPGLVCPCAFCTDERMTNDGPRAKEPHANSHHTN